MDNLKTNLDTFKRKAFTQRGRLRRYTISTIRLCFMTRRCCFQMQGKHIENCKKMENRLRRSGDSYGRTRGRKNSINEALKQEEEILKEEKTSLDKSDAAQLKEQESKLKAELWRE